MSFMLFSVTRKSNPTPKALEISNSKHKVVWSESGVEDFGELVAPTLLSLQRNWANPQTPVTFSLLLQCTNEALISAAKATNKIVDLTHESKPKKPVVPSEIKEAANLKHNAHKVWHNISEDPKSTIEEKTEAKHLFTKDRVDHRRLCIRAGSKITDLPKLTGWWLSDTCIG